MLGKRFGLGHPFDEIFGKLGGEQRLELHLVGGRKLIEQLDQYVVQRLSRRGKLACGEGGNWLGGDLQNAVGDALVGIENRDRGAVSRHEFGESLDPLVRLGLRARFAGEELAHHGEIFVDVIGKAGDRHAVGRADDILRQLDPLLAAFDSVAARHSHIDQLGLAAPAERRLLVFQIALG